MIQRYSIPQNFEEKKMKKDEKMEKMKSQTNKLHTIPTQEPVDLPYVPSLESDSLIDHHHTQGIAIKSPPTLFQWNERHDIFYYGILLRKTPSTTTFFFGKKKEK